jgi:hypothetical protein
MKEDESTVTEQSQSGEVASQQRQTSRAHVVTGAGKKQTLQSVRSMNEYESSTASNFGAVKNNSKRA